MGSLLHGQRCFVFFQLILLLTLTSNLVHANIGQTGDGEITIGVVLDDSEGEAYDFFAPTGYDFRGLSYLDSVGKSDSGDINLVLGIFRNYLENAVVASGHTGFVGPISFRDGRQQFTCVGRTGEVCELNPLGNFRLVGDGICVANQCVTASAEIRVNCDSGDCTEVQVTNPSRIFIGCDSSSGFACSSERGGLGVSARFVQDGICASDGSSPICYTGVGESLPGDPAHICESSGQYFSSCSLCSSGSACTTSFTGGNFDGTGVCTLGKCCPMAIENSDSCSCDEASSGNRCDIGGTGDWDGICARRNGGTWECASGNIYFDGEHYRSEPSSSWDGFMCSSVNPGENFNQFGLSALSGTCSAHPPPVVCGSGYGSACSVGCTATTGYQCTTNTDTENFIQTGTCSNAGCTESDYVCYTGSQYDNSCTGSICSVLQGTTGVGGDQCDSQPSSGGNFAADGICTINGCAVAEEVCVDAGDSDSFKQACSSCFAGSVCNTGTYGTSFSGNGFCAGDTCHVPDSTAQPYVDANNNEDFDDSGFNSRNCNQETMHRLCAFSTKNTNLEREWDGLCIQYDSVWQCDSSLVTCRFDQATNFDETSTCDNSTLEATNSVNSDFILSEIKNSNITNSVLDGSIIYDSVLDGTLDSIELRDSVIINTEICSGVIANNAKISNGVLISGSISYDGKVYSAPAQIDVICSDGIPDPAGYLTFNSSVVADGDDIEVYYVSSETGYSVSVNLQEIGGSTNFVLLDNGVGIDSESNDGIYSGLLSSINYNDQTGYVSIAATVNSGTDVWQVRGTLLISNQPPEASLKIYDLNGDDEVTGGSTVVLQSSYYDSVGIDGCRYANDAPSFEGPFVRCKSSSYWALSSGDGMKNVFMEVRNLAGASVVVSDSILYDSNVAEDQTPPTPPIVLADQTFTNNADSLSFSWYNSTDIEQALLFNSIYYDLWFCELMDGCVYKGYTTEKSITLEELNLEEGKVYNLLVSAFNVNDLYSRNVSSPDVRVDLSAPNAPVITPYNANPVGWNDGKNITFEFSATDNGLSGVSSYSTSLARNPDSNPDNRGNSNGSVYFSSLPDGVYTFKVLAIDNAGNIGPVSIHEFMVDASPPTVPQMLTFQQNLTQNTYFTYEWTKSYDISGIDSYNLQIARDIYFDEIIFNEYIGNFTSYTFSPSDDGAHFARVRARDVSGHNSLFSDKLGGRVDLEPPVITFKKPSSEGVVVSRRPTLSLKTNKIAMCTFAEGVEGLEVVFDITFLRAHESKIYLDEDGDYHFSIRCTDLIGNSITDDIYFTVDTTRSPDALEIITGNNLLYVDQISVINFTVSDGGVFLGEIPFSEFEVSINGVKQNLIDGDYSISDLGAGVYQLAFVFSEAGNKNVKITHINSSVSDSDNFNVKNLNIDFGCESDDFMCNRMRKGASKREEISKYRISINLDDINSIFNVRECPDSNPSTSKVNCLRIENLGDGQVCLSISEDCGPDTVTVVIDD